MCVRLGLVSFSILCVGGVLLGAVRFPRRRVKEGREVPGETKRAIDGVRILGGAAGQGECARAIGFVKQADLQGVERSLRGATGRQAVAQMLHAAEGPVAEEDVRPDAPVMLVGAVRH